MTLEVIEQNEPAIRLYEQLGFVTHGASSRSGRWPPRSPAGEVHDVEPRPLGQADLPWQREDASLPPGCERIEVDGGAALFRDHERDRGSIAQLAARDEVGRA